MSLLTMKEAARPLFGLAYKTLRAKLKDLERQGCPVLRLPGCRPMFEPAHIEAWKRFMQRTAYRRVERQSGPRKLFLSAYHRAIRLQRLPPWADLRKIAAIYRRAHARTARTGRAYHVDHIFPLQGRLVSGLHVHNNLRTITAAENGRKGNKFDV